MLFMVVADDTNSVAMKSHIMVQFNHRIHCNLIKILVQNSHTIFLRIQNSKEIEVQGYNHMKIHICTHLNLFIF